MFVNPPSIIIPLLNSNEPEALLAELHVKEGQQVLTGDLLCTLETTKSTSDLHAEADGYVVGLQFAQGDTVPAGEILCYLARSPDWTPPASKTPSQTTAIPEEEVPKDLRITKLALKLAQEQYLDLHQLPIGPIVTEKMVRELTEKEPHQTPQAPESAFNPTAIVVYGGGGHGKSVIDLLRTLGTYHIIGVVDDGIPAGETLLGIPVLGGCEKLESLYAEGIRLTVNAVGGIGNISIRVKVFVTIAKARLVCPALVHPTAFIEPSAMLSPGNQVFPYAYVGSDVKMGFGVIVNSGAIVSHDCTISDYANISPGAMLAGEVQVGKRVLLGMGVTVNLGVKIGDGARVGNGATVKEDVPEGSVVRAGTIWPG